MGNQWTKRLIILDWAGKATVNRLRIDSMTCATDNKDLTNLRRRHCVMRARNIEIWGEIDGEGDERSLESLKHCPSYVLFVSGACHFDSKLTADRLDEIPAADMAFRGAEP